MSYRNVIISGILALGLLPMAAASASAEDPAVNSQLTALQASVGALQGSVNNLQTTVKNLQAATNNVEVGINTVTAPNQANVRVTPPIQPNGPTVLLSVVNTDSTVHTIQISKSVSIPNGGSSPVQTLTLPGGGVVGLADGLADPNFLWSYTFKVTDGSRTDIRAAVHLLAPNSQVVVAVVAAE
jgi:hypothetical protein